MVPRNTALLALVVAALGAFLYVYEIRGSEKRAEAEAAGKLLFPGLEASDIDSLDLETSDGRSARLERREGAWQLVAPVAFPADPTTLEGLVSALTQLSSEAVYDEPAGLEDYGLAGEPTLRFRTGEAAFALTLGGNSPLGGNSYVAIGDAGRVFAVPTYRTNALRKQLDELRDKRILRFDREAVDRIRLRWPGGGVLLARQEGAWRLIEPLETAADEETLAELLTTLEYLGATGFLDDPVSDAEAGLEAPELQVELHSGGEVAHMRVGGLRGEDRLVRGGVATALYRLPDQRLEALPRKVGAYRFKELARFAPEDAARFEIVFQDEAAGQTSVWKGERGEAGWSTTPEPMRPAAAEDLIAALSALRAEDVVADLMAPAGLAKLGLEPARVTLRVFGADTAAPPLADLRLGAADPERGIAARRGDAETVYRLGFDLGETLPLGLEAFRNRFVETAADESAPEAPAELDFDLAEPFPSD